MGLAQGTASVNDNSRQTLQNTVLGGRCGEVNTNQQLNSGNRTQGLRPPGFGTRRDFSRRTRGYGITAVVWLE